MDAERSTALRTAFADEVLRTVDASSVAIVADDLTVTFGQLVELVAQRQDELALEERSVVVLGGRPSLEWVVTYLALLRDRHVPLLAADRTDDLVAVWSPAVVVSIGDGEVGIERRPSPAGRILHPDLALLSSTSGSTGSPKLVRLSHVNLLSNARAIADYLHLGPSDRGITSLPLHYCYGLSVLHSHLLVGASVVLTEASVVEPCFRSILLDHGVTNVAGVPHTFELLERVGAEQLHVPTLRFMTQAGGKMPSEAVVRWLDRAEEWGCEFFVMYGQTEATARMAYLPPALARRHPSAIGKPIDGGQIRLERDYVARADGVRSDGVHDEGEIIYRGPNVMMGYAINNDDLALGSTVEELRTGDLARFHPDDGVYEIVGRSSRFVKPFGLRIDLDGVERELRSVLDTAEVAVSGDDDGLVISAPGAHHDTIVSTVRKRTGLPIGHIAVDTTTPIPRTASGKTDYTAIDRRAADPSSTTTSATDIVGHVLGRIDVSPHDTFVSLGGDSLSYIECSIRLEAALGHLPSDWHLCPLGSLQHERRPRLIARIDTTVALRAIAICLIVSTHMHLAFLPGGAHLLLAVVGYNLSRFLLPIEPVGARSRAAARTAARVAIPTIAWVAIGTMLGSTYGVGTLLLVNNYTGPASHTLDHWHFWFIEVFIHVLVVLSVLLAVPQVRHLERRFPYAFPLALLGVLLVLRMEWAWMGDWYNLRFRTHGVAWLVALGWLVNRSDTQGKRVVTAALCVLTISDYFGYAPREWLIAISLLILLAWREIPVPRIAVRPLALLASASMWIYITHFTIWPPLVDLLGIEGAYLPTLIGGIAVGVIIDRIVDVGRSVVSRRDVTSARSPEREGGSCNSDPLACNPDHRQASLANNGTRRENPISSPTLSCALDNAPSNHHRSNI